VLDGTLHTLIEIALSAEDARGYFPAMYARVTRRVLDDAAAGRFADAERMQRFVAAFADRYLRANAHPTTAPRCWRAHFDTAGDASLLVVQHLLLGINAHVNYDLAPTVAGLVDAGATLASVRPDFDAVNDVLADVYRDLIHDLDRVTKWTGRADAYGGGRLFRFSLTRARNQAWQAAVRLSALDTAARDDELREIDELVAVVTYLVGHPIAPVRLVLTLLRHLETSDPATVTRNLLGPLASA
jgi:Family of unknown function (DUF5995)